MKVHVVLMPRKEMTVKKLGSIIPAEKLKFWIDMPKTEDQLI